MKRADVLIDPKIADDTEAFPDELVFNGTSLPLRYAFTPGELEDGVTVIVPLAAVNQVDATTAEWLVPGRIVEKITTLIRALPKQLRKNFVPAPSIAASCHVAMSLRDGPLLAALTARLKSITGLDVPEDAWNITGLPDHLRMNFRIVDDRGRSVASGKDIDALRRDLGQQVRVSFTGNARHGLERRGITSWDFGSLPESVECQPQGITVRGFPGLTDEGDSVAIRLFDTRETARTETRAGIERLLRIACRDRLRTLEKEIPRIDAMCLHYASIGSCAELRQDLFGRIVQLAFLDGIELPRDPEGYRSMLETGRRRLNTVAHEFLSLAEETLRRAHEVRTRLARPLNPHPVQAIQDMQIQLGLLVCKGYLSSTPLERLRHYPRYLQGMILRLEKLERDPLRDQIRLAQFLPLWERFQALRDNDAPDAIRWLLEELRISLFAQELKTAERVSVQRICRLLEGHRSTAT